MADWYYVRDGQRIGPLGESDFQSLVDDGTISPETLVWSQGMVD